MIVLGDLRGTSCLVEHRKALEVALEVTVSCLHVGAAENIIVVSDDISLDVGRLRIRRKGSDGGHNGLKSIIYLLNSDNFARIKVGVGKKPHPDYDLAAWVLSRFKNDEVDNLKKAAENSCDAIKLMVEGKTDMAMNKFNS